MMLPFDVLESSKVALATTRQPLRRAKQLRDLLHLASSPKRSSTGRSEGRVSWLQRATSSLQQPPLTGRLPGEPAEGTNKSPLYWREVLRQKASIVQFNIRGVTFEGRQEVLGTLDRGEAVLLVPEPENEHDEHAIAIRRLNGQHLGYVPRESNQYPEFRRGVQLAHIKSQGPTKSMPTYLGAIVEFRPQLRPLHALAAPEGLKTELETLDGVIDRATYRQLCANALKASNGRCEITHSPVKPLIAVPHWQEDTRNRRFSLQGFLCMAPQLLEAHRSVLSENAPQEARWTAQSINGWISSEMEEYIAWQRRLKQQRESESWSLDVSWLELAEI